MKAKLIHLAIRFMMGAIALGIGIWYISSSIGGASLTYTSMDNFITAIGGGSGDVSSINGCFMCKYISDVFGIIGRGAEMFWTSMLNNIWLLLVIGFGIFLFVHTIQYLFDRAKETATLDAKDKKLEFNAWFDKVWRLGARVMIVGAVLGALGMGGTGALRTVSQITITPVMYIGAELSMAATGVQSSASCPLPSAETDDILNPVLRPFMCVMGNLNAVMLAGAAGGFALMNYAWLGMGAGVLTWIAGLALVIMFLLIGFDLFFQVLSIVFKLVFLIVFLPLLIAAYAFEGTWKLANNIVGNSIKMLVGSAVQIVSITLKIIIIYATVSYAADAYFPGPIDNYSAILPPLMGQEIKNPDAQTLSVANVFSECEKASIINDELDKDEFVSCFNTRKAEIERTYPDAFDFLDNGWDFILMMVFLFWLYYFVVSPRVTKLIGGSTNEMFDYGKWIKNLGTKIWHLPQDIFQKVSKASGHG